MDDFKVPSLPPPPPTSKIEKKPIEKKESIADIQENDDENQTSQKPQPATANVCPYKEPVWSVEPDSNTKYKFEVLKSGQIIEEIDDLQKQANWKFGRLPENDIILAHPTISRFHAVLQYRPQIEKDDTEDTESPAEGWYIYDLESTHGTFLNKQRIPPRVFIRIRVGHMLRMGASTRSYILQGPSEDEEPESELSVTELREQRQQQQEAAVEAKKKAREAAEESLRNEGINWGMTEDAEDEPDLTDNPFAATNNEDLFLDDPKRTLRGYFEREDLPLEYKCDEMSAGCFVCRVELPIDDANGRPIVAEVIHKGRKKECVLQCALEACRILDRHGVLRQANQEPLRRKIQKKDSDSDDDEFWDRTGDIARRKQRKSNTNTSVTLTYEELVKQENDLATELNQIETDIAKYQEKQKLLKEQEQARDGADLDSFMENLNEDVSQLDKTEIKKLRLEQQRLKTERQKLQRLIKVAKPYELPFGSTTSTQKESDEKSNTLKRQLPMIGKRNQFTKLKVAKVAYKPTADRETKAFASDEEEMEDDVCEVLKTKGKSEATSVKKETKVTSTAKDETIDSNDKELKNSELKGKTESENENKNKREQITSIEKTQNSSRKLQETNKVVETSEETTIDVSSSSQNDSQTEDNETNAKKRQRHRQRQRYKRQDVDNDELDEHESSEKYAKWVPPVNQTGDGFTSLNEKYGY